jgi:hypothetical protein
MANQVDDKLQKLSGDRTDKVKKIKTLEEKRRKAGLSNAEIKNINNEIKAVNADRLRIEAEYNSLKKVASSAKDYTSLKSQIKTLTGALENAKARGEDISGIRSKLNDAKYKLGDIAPEVEKYFPELKTVAKAPTTTLAGPDAARLTKPTAITPAPAVSNKPSVTTSSNTTSTGKVVPDTFNVGTFRAADEASMAKATGVIPGSNVISDNAKASGLNAAETALGLASTLFAHVDSLKLLLNKYLDPKVGWTDARFLQELRNDPWYKQNSKEIKERYIQLYNYQDLVASGKAEGNTDYEKQIRTLKDQVLNKARAMGSGLASDPAAIQRVAENMYITNTGIEDSLTNNLIAAAIRPIGSTIAGKPTEGYSGKALQDYQTLQGIAKANGFTMADIIPGGSNEQQVLQNIATGAIDVNRIAQDARRLAAQGQPAYVRDLLGQGYNLDQVYAPYRDQMAKILEIGDPNQISLNDPTLRMAITDKGDMNLYDFKKALRQDNRWQYTDTAKQEVSTSALNVLRDFGFQG